MSAVKIHCTLGLNLFFHSAIYKRKRASKAQPLCNEQVRNRLCSTFGNWKMKKCRLFVSIVPWPLPERQSLRNLQKCGAFIAAFTSEKRWMTIKKCLFRNWQLSIDTEFFHRQFAIPCMM
jgi:hypothetical protein